MVTQLSVAEMCGLFSDMPKTICSQQQIVFCRVSYVNVLINSEWMYDVFSLANKLLDTVAFPNTERFR